MNKKKLIEYADLMKEWHPSLNFGFNPQNFSYGSNKKVWWKCHKGHEFEMRIVERTIRTASCPECSGRKVGEDNCLQNLFPSIADEWDETKNGDLTPRDFTSGSNFKAWWICPFGHSYQTQIKSRTRSKSKCPKCSNQTSLPELRIFTELKKLFPSIEHRKKIEGIEVDLFWSEENLAIEYDGAFFHKNRELNDAKKNEKIFSENIRLIRFREEPLEKIDKNDKLITTYEAKELNFNFVKKVFEGLLPIVSLRAKKILSNYILNSQLINDVEMKKIWSQLPFSSPEKSLLSKFPSIAKTWDMEKNKPIMPDQISAKSNKSFWWSCAHGHKFKMQVDIRVRKEDSCPYCSGYRIDETNSLANLRPDVSKYWNYKKNGDLTPQNVSVSSSKSVWWVCSKQHIYKTAISAKTRKYQPGNCPICSGKVINWQNCLKTTHPKLYKEWDKDKNKDINDETISYGSKIKVWWKCANGHSYYKTVKQRTRKNNPEGCPECKKSNPKPSVTVE